MRAWRAASPSFMSRRRVVAAPGMQQHPARWRRGRLREPLAAASRAPPAGDRACESSQHSLGAGQEIGQRQDAIALRGLQVAGGEQAAEPAPARRVRRIGDDVGRAVREDEPRADRQPETLRERLQGRRIDERRSRRGCSRMRYSPGRSASRTLRGGACPACFSSASAAWARTTPATVLRSAMPRPAWPSSSAVSTMSRPCDPAQEGEVGGRGELGVGRVHEAPPSPPLQGGGRVWGSRRFRTQRRVDPYPTLPAGEGESSPHRCFSSPCKGEAEWGARRPQA